MDFRCDTKSKDDFVRLLNRIFKNIIIDVPEEETSRIDIYASAITEDRISKTYAFELKERWGDYTSDRYGKDGDKEGWVYEVGKNTALSQAAEQGYTPMYVNLYPDGVIRVWDMSKYPEEEMVIGEERTYRKHTVDDNGGTYRERKIMLWNRYAKDFERYS